MLKRTWLLLTTTLLARTTSAAVISRVSSRAVFAAPSSRLFFASTSAISSNKKMADEDNDNDDQPVSELMPKKAKAAPKAKKDSASAGEPKRKKARKTKAVAKDGDAAEGDAEPEPKAKKPKKEVADDPIPRSVTGPQPLPASTDPSRVLTIATWNVAGLRALVKTDQDRAKLLETVAAADVDILCMQETKLQTSHVADFVELLPGYRSFWLCSEVTKGYSGVAVFVRESRFAFAPSIAASGGSSQKKATDFFSSSSSSSSSSFSSSSAGGGGGKISTIHSVTYDISTDPRFSGEGRVITLELDSFFLCNCYVPNAGQGLKRIDYRVDEWDPALRTYVTGLREGQAGVGASASGSVTIPFAPKRAGKPVVLTGDLNVAHADLDVYNAKAKHIPKQPGCTSRERVSFSQLLEQSSLTDSFRALYPAASGVYTYWSGRNLLARAENKGLRLDYFLCSSEMLPNAASPSPSASATASGTSASVSVHDVQVLDGLGVGMSDHCPMKLSLTLARLMPSL